VRALYAADDETAAAIQPGFGTQLRKAEDEMNLLGISGRPMTWSEAGYPDASPDLEWAEVVADVQARRGTSAGKVYYKLGFKRHGDFLVLDMYTRRDETREAAAQ
jgi:hypothetical protein